MATIRIKKRASSGSSGAPSSLAPSEVAFNEADKKLYYGFGDNGSGESSSIISIAGEGAVMHLGNVNQTAAGNKTFSGNLTVGGDLTVNGSTSTLNTTNSVVKDKLIELGNGTSGSPSGDAGLVIERGSSDNAFIGWDESSDKFVLGTGTFTGATTGNLSITGGTVAATTFEGALTGNVTGNVTGSSGSCTGNAATATQLANTRTFSLTGDVTGSATFNGTGNAAISSTIASGAVDLSMLSASGTKSSSTFLRGDNTFAVVATTDTTYTAGSGLTLTGTVFSLTTDTTNASNISSGTLAAARLPNHSASLLTSGTIPAARVPTLNQNTTGTSGGFTAGNGSNLNSGTIPAARIGTVDGGTF